MYITTQNAHLLLNIKKIEITQQKACPLSSYSREKSQRAKSGLLVRTLVRCHTFLFLIGVLNQQYWSGVGT